jgi:hypothetical protein
VVPRFQISINSLGGEGLALGNQFIGEAMSLDPPLS